MNTRDKIDAVKAAAQEISDRERDSNKPATQSAKEVAKEIADKVKASQS